jgi:hypothetical protein
MEIIPPVQSARRETAISGTGFAGISIMSCGLVFLFTACVGTATFDCFSLLLIPLGVSIRNGNRNSIPWAMGFSILSFFTATAFVSNICATDDPFIAENVIRISITGCYGLWSLFNIALLYRLNWYYAAPAKPAQNSDSPENPSAAQSAPAKQPFQYSLRSLLVISLIFAVAVWFGTILEIPSYRTGSRSGFFYTTLPDGTRARFCYGISYRDADVPVVGYLWMDKEHDSPIESTPPLLKDWLQSFHTSHFKVNGETIRPSAKFQLFVNDLEGEPLRLTLPRAEAKELFGGSCSNSNLEQFWLEVVEPKRKAAANPPAESP